ncbi:MAG: hypothetical protein BGO32_00910 [Bacteroidetes bacterium 37-13]|nr:MAG: hypothetical protein BGO32_00910 [Bacteroidetes bacterium 37-13]
MNKIFYVALSLIAFSAKSQDGVMVDLKPDSVVPPAEKVNHYLFNYTQPSDFLNPFTSNWDYESTPNRFEIVGGLEGNSNGLNQQFVWNILGNKGYTSKVKYKIRNGLKTENGYEDNTTAGVRYKYYSKKFNGFFTAGYNFRTMRLANFNKEVYELLLYGNAMFENKTVDLSGTRFQNSLYNQFSLGFYKNIKVKSYTISLGLNASFLHGMNNQSLYVNKGTLFTAQDGEYIDLIYDLRYDQNQGGDKRKREKADVGMSGDMFLRMDFNKKFAFSFSIVDIGAINWRTQPRNYYGSGNDTVHFKGIEFTDITNITSSNLGGVKVDSILKSFLPTQHSDKYQTFLPFTLNFTVSKPFWKDKIVVNAGIQYKPLYKYYVYGFVKTNYFVKPDLVTSLTLGYGGYSKFNVGIEAAKHWRYFDLAIGTNNLIGTVAPLAYTGTSAYLRLGVNF